MTVMNYTDIRLLGDLHFLCFILCSATVENPWMYFLKIFCYNLTL